jgi:hypothetical protein
MLDEIFWSRASSSSMNTGEGESYTICCELQIPSDKAVAEGREAVTVSGGGGGGPKSKLVKGIAPGSQRRVTSRAIEGLVSSYLLNVVPREDGLVVYFDNELRFHAQELRRVVKEKLQQEHEAKGVLGMDFDAYFDIEKETDLLLSRVHLIRPKDSIAFITALVQVENALRNRGQKRAEEQQKQQKQRQSFQQFAKPFPPALLVVDSLAAFHWKENMLDKLLAAGKTGAKKTMSAKSPPLSGSSEMFLHLQRIQKLAAINIVAIKPLLGSSTASYSAGVMNSEYKNSSWSKWLKIKNLTIQLQDE